MLDQSYPKNGDFDEEQTGWGGGSFNLNRDHFLHSADLLLVITLRLNLHKDDVVLLGSGHQDCRLDEQP